MTKNKTTVRPQSYQLLVYHEQPTTKNTKIGDMVLYKSELWLNDGNIVAPMSLNNYINIDKNGTILDKPLTKDYVDEKVEEALKENIMDNYIVINGKKAELTEEQLKQLGLKVEEKRNNPFDRVNMSKSYYFIHGSDNIFYATEDCPDVDHHYYDNANYFNDKDFANQVMLHQQLYRKLLKYAYDHEAEDREWDKANINSHYFIYFDSTKGHFIVGDNCYCHSQNVYFSKQEVAEQAIEDIIKPFMIEYPEFVW